MVYLNGANKSEARLSDALTIEADFHNASDSRTNLSQADLSHANLSYANLRIAISHQAKLDGAKLCRANLSDGIESLATDLTGG